MRGVLNKYVVIETGTSGKRHLHALLQFDGPKQAKAIKDVVWRNMRKYHDTSLQKYAVVINVCYDMKWYEEYLRKAEIVENRHGRFRCQEFQKGSPGRGDE